MNDRFKGVDLDGRLYQCLIHVYFSRRIEDGE